MGMTAVVPYSGATTLARMEAWTAMAPDDRKRRAVGAARDHDAEALVGLTLAILALDGHAGAHVSVHTGRNYTHGARVLLDAWTRQNLLHPDRDAGGVWVRQMEGAGLKPSTIKVRLAAARTLYRGLRWAGATDADPFKDVRPARDTENRWDKRGPYTPDELAVMLTALDTTIATATPAARTMAVYDRALVLLGSHAGLRASEMMALRWTDLDFSHKVVVVQQGKGGKRRRVVMSGTLGAALEAIPDAMRGEYVLPYRSRNTALYRLERLTQKVGIKQRGLHRLRHSAGTRLMRETNNLQEVAELLGHAQLDTARVYAQWANDTQRRVVGEW